MNNVPKEINNVLDKIWTETAPISIFLYGSMARDDYQPNSDYEVGVIYKKDKKVSRSELAKLHDYKNLKLYPFVMEELIEETIDTPFPKAIYLSSLRDGGKTILGKDIKEIIREVDITKDDLMESIGFSLGRAYCAVVSSRQNDMVAVQENFSKSVFYGLQILLFLKNNELVGSYKMIVEKTKDLVPDEFRELVKNAIEVRKDKTKIESSKLYNAISFLNKVVLAEIKKE